jgi:hypothetical protein
MACRCISGGFCGISVTRHRTDRSWRRSPEDNEPQDALQNLVAAPPVSTMISEEPDFFREAP